MQRATDDEIRKRLEGHIGRREVITIEFEEVGREVAFRPATRREYQAYLADTQPRSASRFVLVANCLLSPNAEEFGKICDELPAALTDVFGAIDEEACAGDMHVFDVTDAVMSRFTIAPDEVARLRAANRALKGVMVWRATPHERTFLLKPAPRATYEDYVDHAGAPSFYAAADRAALDCIVGMTSEDRDAMLERHPGIPSQIFKTIAEMAGAGKQRKKASRVV